MSAAPVEVAPEGADLEPDTTRGSDFAALARAVRAGGLLRRRPLAYAARIVLTGGFYVGAWASVVGLGDSWWQCVTAVVLGLAFTQIAFLGHDFGHQQVFRSRRANDAFGIVLGDLLVGLSYGWWVAKHNRHHANPNKEGCDPDIGDGVLAFTPAQVADRGGRISRIIAGRQAWLFFPMLALEGLNLHVSSVQALRRGGARSTRGGSRRMEFLLLTIHLVAYSAGVLLVMSPMKALVFVAIHQATWGLYMGCSFAPNHKGMTIVGADEDIDFLRRQVLTSRNVRGGWFTDLLLGGLNYQVEHHLFPNMPRASLRLAHPIIRSYCTQRAIPFCETSLIGSYRSALGHLHALGKPLRATS